MKKQLTDEKIIEALALGHETREAVGSYLGITKEEAGAHLLAMWFDHKILRLDTRMPWRYCLLSNPQGLTPAQWLAKHPNDGQALGNRLDSVLAHAN
jgi:hypothetical protein